MLAGKDDFIKKDAFEPTLAASFYDALATVQGYFARCGTVTRSNRHARLAVALYAESTEARFGNLD